MNSVPNDSTGDAPGGNMHNLQGLVEMPKQNSSSPDESHLGGYGGGLSDEMQNSSQYSSQGNFIIPALAFD
jgi:hypothetical protein